jgi:predicted amidohydrolase YtcJ
MVMMSKIRFTAIACAVLAAIGVAAQPDGAELMLTNGKVFTADQAMPWAEALAIRGDRIAAVGTAAAVRTRLGANAHVVDVGGRVVIPGINDAHTHVGVRPPGVSLKLDGNEPALADVVAAIRQAAASAPEDRWIYGTVGERVLSDPKATRFTLDEAAPGRLVKLSGWTGHGVVFSTPGLRAIGIADRAPNPPFGTYRRTPDGVIDGHLDEYADLRAHRRLAALAGHTAAVDSLRRVAVEAATYGVTTIQAMANAFPAVELATMLQEAKATVRFRIIRFPIAMDEKEAPEDFGELPRNPYPWITVSGVSGSSTARRSSVSPP